MLFFKWEAGFIRRTRVPDRILIAPRATLAVMNDMIIPTQTWMLLRLAIPILALLALGVSRIASR